MSALPRYRATETIDEQAEELALYAQTTGALYPQRQALQAQLLAEFNKGNGKTDWRIARWSPIAERFHSRRCQQAYRAWMGMAAWRYQKEIKPERPFSEIAVAHAARLAYQEDVDYLLNGEFGALTRKGWPPR